MTTKIKSGVIGDNVVGITQLNVSDGTNGQVLTTDGSGTLSFSTVSGTTINNNADNRIITGSGTANTLNGESTLTFDGSNLNLNTTSPTLTIESGDSQDSKILFREDGGSAVSLFYEGSAGTGQSNNLHIRRELSGSETNLVTFGLDGDVGIGTDSPDTKLNIVDTNPKIRITRTSDFYYGELSSDGFSAFTNTNSSAPIIFNTGTSERMRITSTGDITMSGTGAIKVPSGTTAQRPTSPVNGMIRYNTTLGATEEYRGGAWVTLSAILTATGGTITESGGYKIHTFTSSGTFEITSGSGDIEFLVIAGGGGGSGRDIGGGGGAGGYRCSVSGESSGGGGSAETALTLGKGTYTVTVGAGGAGGTDGGVASQGNDSVFATITSVGGGGARSYNVAQPDDAGGGSGGGGAGITYLTAGSGTANQGYDGGDGASGSENTYGGGGGGGASQAGAAAGSTANPGTRNGGNGIASSITGSSVTRAGGGGGAGHRSSGNGSLGAGGTGGGASATAVNGVDSNRNGTANTGGGGGASRGTSQTGGTGGTGIVIVRYIP
jgi:hypothetical protein